MINASGCADELGTEGHYTAVVASMCKYFEVWVQCPMTFRAGTRIDWWADNRVASSKAVIIYTTWLDYKH